MNDSTARRFENEIAEVNRVVAANPDRIEGILVNRLADDSPVSIYMFILVRTAVKGADRDGPLLDRVPVRLTIPIGAGYPKQQPEVFIGSPVPLFVGAVVQARIDGTFFGSLCPTRDYDPHRNSCLQLLANAWNALSGQTINSKTDCINRDAARHWLHHSGDLPFDEQLVLPSAYVPSGQADQDFVLEEVPA